MKYLIIILAGVCVFYLFNKYMNSPHRHRRVKPEQLDSYISTLYRRGFNNGFMIIKTRGRREFVQFTKIISREKDVSLYSPVKWVGQYYDSILSFLSQKNIDFKIVDNDNGEVIEIFCGNNLKLCKDIVLGINLEVFKVSLENLNFTIWFHNINDKDIFVDDISI